MELHYVFMAAAVPPKKAMNLYLRLHFLSSSQLEQASLLDNFAGKDFLCLPAHKLVAFGETTLLESQV